MSDLDEDLKEDYEEYCRECDRYLQKAMTFEQFCTERNAREKYFMENYGSSSND